MINLNNCKEGDILICKHGVIKEYVKPIKKGESADFYDHRVKYLYYPFSSEDSIEYRNQHEGFKESNGTVCNDGFVYRKKRLESDSDVIKVVDREVFKRYLRMLANKI